MQVVNRHVRVHPRILILLVGIAVAHFGPRDEARAQDASFGCKVLLCVAASAPGWAGIPYCVPVMQQLFTQLARRGGWPVCSEARASSIGYEPYLPCPDGYAPGAYPSTDDQSSGGQSANLCVSLSPPRQDCSPGDLGICTTVVDTVPRQSRPDPYFVDLSTASGSQRFRFSLQGY